MLYSFRKIYKDYLKDEESIPYEDFKHILEIFNKKLSEKIIKGYKFKIGHNLGTIKIVKKERKFRLNENGNPTSAINWGASNKRKAELLKEGKKLYDEKEQPNGEEWLVFFTDRFFIRFLWNRGDTTTFSAKNIRTYAFRPTWTNKRSLSLFVQANKDRLHLNYHNDDI